MNIDTLRTKNLFGCLLAMFSFINFTIGLFLGSIGSYINIFQTVLVYCILFLFILISFRFYFHIYKRFSK